MRATLPRPLSPLPPLRSLPPRGAALTTRRSESIFLRGVRAAELLLLLPSHHCR